MCIKNTSGNISVVRLNTWYDRKIPILPPRCTCEDLTNMIQNTGRKLGLSEKHEYEIPEYFREMITLSEDKKLLLKTVIQ